MSITYKVGCDPELFLVNKDGLYRSAHDIIPGTKYDPYPVTGGAIQVDGTAAEFNTNPASDSAEFSKNIRSVLSSLKTHVSRAGKDLSLKVVPVAVFEKDYFDKLPPEAKVFGCNADFNAWTSKQNDPPETSKPFRTGAGHIHIGWTEQMDVEEEHHIRDCEELVKQLDVTLYMMSLLWDKDTKRRTLYGAVGAYRPKHYGVEYRSLSNVFVADPNLHVYVFNAAKKAAILLDSNRTLYEKTFPLSLLARARNHITITRENLLRYHDYLVNVWQFPSLPQRYLGSPVTQEATDV